MVQVAEAPISIPDRIDQLDRDWFQAALGGDRPSVVVKAARVAEVIHGTCTKIRVTLDYDEGGDAGLPRSMLVKGGFADHSHLFLAMHRTEALYYRDIAPRACFDTPACFFSGIDPGNGRSLVVLEDLDMSNVRWLSALDPLDWRDEAAFIDALSAFAGQYWESPELNPGGRLEWVIHSYEGEAAAYIEYYLDPSRWSAFLALPRCACLPKALHDRDRMRVALDQLRKRLDRQPMTLSHGDTHLGNLYLTHDGAPCFLDAQPRRAPWAKDFTYHMIAALDVEDRRRWERPLLARYLRGLEGRGLCQVPSFDEAWHDYRCEIAYGLFIFMINESRFQREEINTAYTARFGAAAIDHGSFALIGA